MIFSIFTGWKVPQLPSERLHQSLTGIDAETHSQTWAHRNSQSLHGIYLGPVHTCDSCEAWSTCGSPPLSYLLWCGHGGMLLCERQEGGDQVARFSMLCLIPLWQLITEPGAHNCSSSKWPASSRSLCVPAPPSPQ